MNQPDPYDGSVYRRNLDDGRIIVVYPMIFTTRVCVGPQGEAYYDNAWCYVDMTAAIAAAREWDGEGDPPAGWIKQVGTERRRVDGDPEREYVA